MINLTKYFSQTLNQFQFDSYQDEWRQALAPWEDSNINLVKHFSSSAKKSSQKAKFRLEGIPNVQSLSPSKKTSRRASIDKSHKSLKTYPCIDDKKHSRSNHSLRPAKSTNKLPMLISKNFLKITLKKSKAKGRFREFIEDKCKQNKEMDKKIGDKMLNLYKIEQIRQSILSRKAQLIKSRTAKIK